MLVTFFGMEMEVKLLQPWKAELLMLVKPVKYWSSLKEVIDVFPLSTSPKVVTISASS